ncbi:MAG: hypothetical protein F4052_08725 [Dehalococcoidia bacterium]|nr:hypothetical protein [Dehalococcoidia bacterium]MYK27007.1 hypothetical protein [Dehalococcoidia bacterium]
MTTDLASEANAIPGARLLLDQMVRLNDNVIVSVDQLRQKSRAYLSVGALAVTASAALLALSSDLPDGLWIGSVVALVLFGMSAVAAVLAERTTALPDAPDILDLADLVNQPDSDWSDDQIAFWVAREYIDRIQPIAERELRATTRLVSAQMFLFLGEVTVVGGTLTGALAY